VDPSSKHEVANTGSAIVGRDGVKVAQQHGMLAGSVTVTDVAPREPVEIECRVWHPGALQEIGHLRRDRRFAHTEQAGQQHRLHAPRLAAASGRCRPEPRYKRQARDRQI
jgi:hypothetical protein